MKIMFLLFALFLTSCSTNSTFVPNTDLWIPWSEEAQRKSPITPYVTHYAHDSKYLTYIAANHEYERPNPTFSLIQREIESFRPEIVIIEGVFTRLGMSPKEIIDALPGKGSEFQKGSESLYAAYVARNFDIPFVGAEPSFSDIMKSLQKKQYSEKDLLYYYVVRQIGQWKREKADLNQTFDTLFVNFMKYNAKQIGLNPDDIKRLNVNDFKDWYRKYQGTEFNHEQITAKTTKPDCSENAGYIQQLACCNTKIRDFHIVNVIANMLNQYDRVLVVYGSGHHIMQLAILKELMGDPEIIAGKAGHSQTKQQAD